MHKITGGSGCAAALPTALLAQILQHVPQQQRLTQCALVCSSWKPAAAQATVHVAGSIKPDAVTALQSWLAVHAGQLLSLNISHDQRQALQLPLDKLTQLQHLQLTGFKLQLPGDQNEPCSSSAGVSSKDSNEGSSSALAAPQPTLCSLQHLELDFVELASVSSLLQLTNAPQLTSLKLSSISVDDVGYSWKFLAPPSEVTVQKMADAIARMLQQLPRLSVLQLPDLPFSDAAAQQTSAMHGLQQINVTHKKDVPMGDMLHLPSSVTELKLHGQVPSRSPSLPEKLPQLSALLHLDLLQCQVPPTVLGGLTHLQVLRLEDSNLLPHVPNTEWETEGTAALLTALSGMTRLQELTLHNLIYLDTENIPPEQFSALTASSQLTKLDLYCENFMTIPSGAAQHMFPPGRQMPSLHHVVIETVICMSDMINDWCLTASDLDSIITACPNLHGLSIGLSLLEGSELFPLLQLPQSCTQLSVGGPAFTNASARVIAQLTQLKDLQWTYSLWLTDAGLLELLVLDLKKLHLHSCGLSEQVFVTNTGEVLLEYKEDLSVQEQLDALLDNSPVLAPARLKRWQDRYRSLQAECDELRQQLSAAQAGQQQQQQQLDGESAGQQQQQ